MSTVTTEGRGSQREEEEDIRVLFTFNRLGKGGVMQEIQGMLLLKFGSGSEVACVNIQTGSQVKVEKSVGLIAELLAFQRQDKYKSETWKTQRTSNSLVHKL